MKSILLFLLFALMGLSYSQTAYRFVVMGDRTGSAHPGVFEKLRDQALALKPMPSFFINVGDLIQGYESDTNKLKPQWDELKKILTPFSTASIWHQVPGNHDITTDTALPLYLRYAGNPYNAFDVGPDRFIILDASRFDNPQDMDSLQKGFLKKEIQKATKARYVFFFYHKPFYDVAPQEPIMDSLHHLFKSAGVNVVVNGHYHQYCLANRDSIQYLIVGSSGGGTDNNKIDGTRFHYVLFDVSPTGIKFNPITIDGDTLPPDWNTPALQKKRAEILDNGDFVPINLKYTDTFLFAKKFEWKVTNPTDSAIKAKVRWIPPANGLVDLWHITPSADSVVNLAPGKSKTISFAFTQKEVLPGPQSEFYFSSKYGNVSAVIRPLIRKQLPIYKASQMVVDGDIAEKVWQKTIHNRQSTFCNIAQYYDSTWIAASYDSTNIYLAFKAYDPSPDSLRATTPKTVRDECESTQDIILFYLASPKDTNHAYRVYASCNGAIRDEKTDVYRNSAVRNKAWNGISDCAVKKTEMGWQGEIVLPWKSIGMKTASPLLFNCKRVSPRIKDREGPQSYQSPIKENPSQFASTWLEK